MTTITTQPRLDRRFEATATATAEVSKPPASFVKICAITMLILTAVFTFGIWIPTWLILGDSATGLGVGLMSALWGAPGFGIMIAGAIWTEQGTKH